MYWVINNKKYVIQATNTLSLDKEIPIGIQTLEGGNIKIKIDTLENVAEDFLLYIKDNTTGETYNITENDFEMYLEAGEYLNRFFLTFQPRLKTSNEIELTEGIHIYMNNTTSEMQFSKIIDVEIESITVYNYLGQTLKTVTNNLTERFISIPITVNTGIYLVKVKTNKGSITKKIVVQ